MLAEVDYFLRDNRTGLRKLIAEIFDPATGYEYELPLPSVVVRALEFDARFKRLDLGLFDSPLAALTAPRKVYRVLTTDHRDLCRNSCRPALPTTARLPAVATSIEGPERKKELDQLQVFHRYSRQTDGTGCY